MPELTEKEAIIERVRASERECEQYKEEARRSENWRMFFLWMGWGGAMQRARNFIEEANGA